MNLLVVLTVVWNTWTVVGGLLYAYFSYRKYEFATRRYPGLTLVQLLALNLWENAYINRTALSLDYGATFPYMSLPITQFAFQSIAIPIFVVIGILKGFSLANEHFSTVRMLQESHGNAPFDEKIHLNLVERTFFSMQQKVFHLPDGDGGGAGIVRRYQPAFSVRILLGIFVVSVVMIPLGLLCGGCFDPDVGYPRCMYQPYWIRNYFPLVATGFIYSMWFPVMMFMLRHLSDPFYLKSETIFNTGYLMVNFTLYLLFDWSAIPFGDSLRGGIMWACGLPMMSITMVYFPICLCVRKMIRESGKKSRADEKNTPEAFQRMLKDLSVVKELHKVLAANYCLENGLFWSEYNDAVQRLSNPEVSLDDREATLRMLYLAYIQHGSHRELNLTHSTRHAVVAKYRLALLTIDDFAPVAREVFNMMFQNSYPQLLKALGAGARPKPASTSPSLQQLKNSSSLRIP